MPNVYITKISLLKCYTLSLRNLHIYQNIKVEISPPLILHLKNGSCLTITCKVKHVLCRYITGK